MQSPWPNCTTDFPVRRCGSSRYARVGMLESVCSSRMTLANPPPPFRGGEDSR
jgi:hypothetical protein